MSAVDMRAAVGALLSSNWNEATHGPIAWPNMTFTPEPTLTFIKFSMSSAQTDQIEFGADNATVRDTGRVFVQVFVPVGKGDKRARELCDILAKLFKDNKQLTTPVGRIIFRRANIKDIGASGPHYQFNVSIPYLYDTI